MKTFLSRSYIISMVCYWRPTRPSSGRSPGRPKDALSAHKYLNQTTRNVDCGWIKVEKKNNKNISEILPLISVEFYWSRPVKISSISERIFQSLISRNKEKLDLFWYNFFFLIYFFFFWRETNGLTCCIWWFRLIIPLIETSNDIKKQYVTQIPNQPWRTNIWSNCV